MFGRRPIVQDNKSARWTFAINLVFSLLIILLFTYQYLYGWFYLGGKNGFGDLNYVLERIPCLEGSWDLLYGPRTTETCSGYTYGLYLLIALNFLGVSSANLALMSYILIASFTLIFLWIIYHLRLNLLQKSFAIILFFSPPIVLLVERLNLDLIIFILLYIAAKLPERVSKWVAPILIAGTALAKFYTLPIILLMYRSHRKKLNFYLTFIICSTLLVIFFDFGRILSLPWDARNMFGNVIWGEYLMYLVSGPQSHANFIAASALGLIMFLVIYLSMIHLPFSVQLRSIDRKSDHKLFFYVSTVYVTCYFSGLSVDFRLVFLLFTYLIFESLFELNKLGIITLRVSVATSFFMSYNVEELQPLGDIAQIIVLSFVVRGLTLLNRSAIRDISNKRLEISRVIFSRISRYR